MKQIAHPISEFSQPFTALEIDTAISHGTNTKRWLCKFYSNILDTGILPAEFKETKIIAILKPGKDNDRPESYRPIALLSCCLKLLERTIYNRISKKIFEHIQPEKMDFVLAEVVKTKS